MQFDGIRPNALESVQHPQCLTILTVGTDNTGWKADEIHICRSKQNSCATHAAYPIITADPGVNTIGLLLIR